MKCSRCQTKFGRNDHFAMFYIRTTDGKSQSYPLCRKCVLGFTEFMKDGMPEEPQPNNGEVEDAYINNAGDTEAGES